MEIIFLKKITSACFHCFVCLWSFLWTFYVFGMFIILTVFCVVFLGFFRWGGVLIYFDL